MFGCHSTPDKALSERFPSKFGDWDVERCPWALLRSEWDPQLDAIINAVSDYQQGLMPGWPDAYSAAIVDGVRYFIAQRNACEAEVMRRANEG